MNQVHLYLGRGRAEGSQPVTSCTATTTMRAQTASLSPNPLSLCSHVQCANLAGVKALPSCCLILLGSCRPLQESHGVILLSIFTPHILTEGSRVRQRTAHPRRPFPYRAWVMSRLARETLICAPGADFANGLFLVFWKCKG